MSRIQVQGSEEVEGSHAALSSLPVAHAQIVIEIGIADSAFVKFEKMIKF
jgi:hypothetical protein